MIERRAIAVSEGALDLRQFFADLGDRTGRVGPVEPDGRRPFAEPIREEQFGQVGREPIEDPAGPFLLFQRFPRFLRAKIEEVRMAPLHLGLEIRGHLVRRELGLLLRQDQLPGQMQEQVSHFPADLSAIAAGDGVVEFVDFLDQVGTEGFPGLDSIPRAPFPKIGHHRHCAPKR